MEPSRRGFLLGSAAALSLGNASLQVRAAETDKRLILIFLRGALDGLNVVVPYGDRNLKKWRESLVLPEPGQPGGLSDLGGFWGLHPSLKAMHAIYRANDLLPLQAVAGPNRSRSHFEAQDMMEIGAEKRMTSGWLNRLTALLPRASIGDTAVSMGTMTPLILHGPTPVTTWNPFHARPTVSPGFYENIVAMHAPDAQTGSLLGDALAERRHLDKLLAGVSYDGISGEFPRLARAAARMLASADGPRLAELDLDGWDTHTNQHVRLTQALRQLDDGIAILRAGLAEVWPKTAILVITEFGRTVRVNGTNGTDHGTGTVAFLLGGSVAGGRVFANWPGLGATQLYEGRDLQPTRDLRAIYKGVLEAHLGIPVSQMDAVFPESDSVPPQSMLLRS